MWIRTSDWERYCSDKKYYLYYRLYLKNNIFYLQFRRDNDIIEFTFIKKQLIEFLYEILNSISYRLKINGDLIKKSMYWYRDPDFICSTVQKYTECANKDFFEDKTEIEIKSSYNNILFSLNKKEILSLSNYILVKLNIKINKNETS